MTAEIMKDGRLDLELQYLKNNKIIRDGKDTFVKVGVALEEVRDTKSYIGHYKTFEDFCQEEHGFTRQYANRMINAAEAVNSLDPKCKLLVDNPNSAAELSKVPEGKRNQVVKAARKVKGTASAAAIVEAAREILSTPSKDLEVFRDDLGVPIPSKIMQLWDRRNEVKEMVQSITDIRLAVSRGIKESDPMYRELQNTAIADIEHARQVLTYAVPYTVCTACNGQLIEECTLCRGRGFLSKQRYMTVPEEIREMREKVIRKGTK